MIDAAQIGEIIAVYKKYGWQLRRILLSADLKKQVDGNIPHVVEGVRVKDADIDAAWFSRPPTPGGVAWELRHLSKTPYALLEYIDETDADFEHALRDVEVRLRENVGRAKSA